MTPRPRPLGKRQELALAPVRGAMLDSASAEVGQILAGAHSAADALLEQARRDAASMISKAREEGRAQAAPLAHAEISRGQREARATVLRAELHARDDLELRIRAAITGLKDEPGYRELRDRLAKLALRAAGPGATVSEHPAGGVVARAPGVLVDCSLPRLAQRAIEALGPRITELGAA
jgi:vacuolar-type H+-ATPase subunit E/Vma4